MLRYIFNLQNEQLLADSKRDPGKTGAHSTGNNPKAERNGVKSHEEDDGYSKSTDRNSKSNQPTAFQ